MFETNVTLLKYIDDFHFFHATYYNDLMEKCV